MYKWSETTRNVSLFFLTPVLFFPENCTAAVPKTVLALKVESCRARQRGKFYFMKTNNQLLHYLHQLTIIMQISSSNNNMHSALALSGQQARGSY